MIIFGKKITSKILPALIGVLAAVILFGAFALSASYAPEVLANNGVDDTGRSGFVFCGDSVDNPCKISHLFISLVIIINYLMTMVGIVAILFIVIAGVQMTTSRGEEGLVAAKKRLTGALIGLVLVVLAFVIVNTLFAGSLSLGIRNGGLILTNPKEYINKND
ncbi:MAG TPA: pilin [Candidatus Doudnabacteria bacterium]|nr:pilin [Candidatus Doudnabacteria bacterium]